jgi:hypothetical protein
VRDRGLDKKISLTTLTLYSVHWLDDDDDIMMTITNGKPEVRGFVSRLCHCNSSLTQHFRAHYGPEIYSASNRNECQEYFLENSCANSLEISQSQPTGTLRICPGLNRNCFTFTSIMNNVLDTMCKDISCYDLPGWRIFANILSHFSVPVETRIGHFPNTSRVTAWVIGFADRVF